MTDPGQLQSRFLAGGRTPLAGINVSADRIPLCIGGGNVSPADFFNATGGGSYTTAAVVFDGATYLQNAALVCADASSLTVSMWLWCSHPYPSGQQGGLWVCDPTAFSYAALSAATNVFPDGNGPGGLQQTLFNADESAYAEGDTGNYSVSNGSWHHVLTSYDVGAANKRAVYVDGVQHLPMSGAATDLNTPFTMSLSGKLIQVGHDSFDGDQYIGYLADFWWAAGVSLLNGSGVIPPATLAKFISGGKPVDLGANGSTPTGAPPQIFMRRAPAAAPSTFATNLGTGGPFATTGTLTAAPSSPSD